MNTNNPDRTKRAFIFTALAAVLILVVSILGGCSQPVTTGAEGSTTAVGSLRPIETGANTRVDTAASSSSGGKTDAATDAAPDERELAAISVEKNGRYTSKMEVAAYLYQFGELPSNYITKNDARDLGWSAQKGNLWDVTDEMSIGGDRFGNFEGLLPEKNGRQYFECDIDYNGGRRGAKRIVFSNDGLIFYTGDHYESFERLD